MPSICRFALAFLMLAAIPTATLRAVPGDAPPPPEEPQITAASDEGQQALAGFKIPAGLKGEIWAAEPMLANPVAFCLDSRGRIYVCETFRQSRGIEDNRGHDHWLDDDLAAMTIEDRLAYIQKHLGDKANDYTKHDDRVRLLEDTDGDGKADKQSIFADRFNSILDGTAAGILVREGNVFLTCIPHLWLLRDEDGDGKAEVRKPLSTGFGVRFAFRGHDLHGLVIGPDGRLYFSVGDRGLNVKTQEGTQLVNPESGAVLRCELDGSNLEIFATGLRNPQELAFDEYGNLFTGDNNSDSGDQARWVHVVEGGDSGWRMAYQYLPDRGPFNREKIWRPYDPVKHAATGVPEQPANIVPPITNFASGPSGLAYYPGTGLTDHFRGRFLLVDFRGGPVNSGVRSFRVKPKGASFELIDAEETIWNVLATDVDFGPDGAIYLTDWVNGWNGEGKGRIYRFHSPEAADSEIVKQVTALLAEGFNQRPIDELVGYLSHADRRVRQEAQFALVEKKAAAPLSRVARESDSQFARLHAIWGLGQLARRKIDHANCLKQVVANLAGDTDAEVRAQAAQVLGDLRHDSASDEVRRRLADESPRVRMSAAIALGKMHDRGAIAPLLSLLEEDANQDPILRHAAVMGLAGAADGSPAALVAHAKHPSPAARLGVLLALRRLSSEQTALFLNDSDPFVVIEAARAIHDVPIPAALPQLAALVTRGIQGDALIRRVLNANFRLGAPQNAAAIAAYAARPDAPESMRLEALDMLANWAKPSNRDRVLGMWRPLAERPAAEAAAALRTNLAGIFSGPDKVRAIAAQVAAKLEIKEVIPELCSLLADLNQPPQSRADALSALVSVKYAEIEPTARQSLTDQAPAVRAAARSVLAQLKVDDAVALLDRAIAGGECVERQSAFAALANLRGPAVNELLAKSLDRLLAGEFPADAELDLISAVEPRLNRELRDKLREYQSRHRPDDPLAVWRACLIGGDAERGKKLFFERGQLSCVRCHKIGETGGDVGPELTKIAADKEKHREYLLESVVTPSKTIAKNFETVVIQGVDGRQHTGILKQEDSEKLTLMTAEGQLVEILQADIEARKAGKSSMPEDLTKHLTRHELRDLVEFLSALK
ncbi:MAG TPA: PVC-type heme-binding CxxCH protein [Pirellulaceae bacterium]|nr:PVC-type heme-binding CxxCH protein [Pirellulaceae bacterium]